MFGAPYPDLLLIIILSVNCPSLCSKIWLTCVCDSVSSKKMEKMIQGVLQEGIGGKVFANDHFECLNRYHGFYLDRANTSCCKFSLVRISLLLRVNLPRFIYL